MGLAGWQWVFVATGIPAVIVAVVVFRVLPASVRDARFLDDREKQIVEAALEREKPAKAEHGQPWKALLDPRVMLFAATYMLMSTSLYGVTYWLPTLVKSFGVSSSMNGFLSMLPWALAVLLLLWLPAKLRRAKSILRTIAIVAALGALGFLLSLVLPSTPLRFLALVLGGACIPLLYPCFWSMPPRYFTGARAAASVAAINSIGNLGGFFSQNLMPFAGKVTGTAFGPMIVPIVCLALLGIGALVAWTRSERGWWRRAREGTRRYRFINSFPTNVKLAVAGVFDSRYLSAWMSGAVVVKRLSPSKMKSHVMIRLVSGSSTWISFSEASGYARSCQSNRCRT